MAVEIYFKKINNVLVPSDIIQEELLERLKNNSEYKAVLSQPRNLPFHKKGFTMAHVGFDLWQPPEDRQFHGKPILKNFDVFRDEMTTLAGFYDPVWSINGTMKFNPHSWAFAAADQEKFERMYSGCIDVLFRDVLSNTRYTREELDAHVNKILGFC